MSIIITNLRPLTENHLLMKRPYRFVNTCTRSVLLTAEDVKGNDGMYGKFDNLHVSYDGNRISSVLEDAGPVTQNGSMDYPGGNREMAFEYNEWGALVKDESRGITDISYDRFGNPLRISFKDGSYTENVYSASGEKLRMTHATSLNGTVTGKTTTEYRGNVIYRDGKVDMVLFPGGYATINGSAVTFHYYTQDYLGNNRAVINGSTGAVSRMAFGKHCKARFKKGPNLTIGTLFEYGVNTMYQIPFSLNEQKSIFFMIFKHFRLQNCFKDVAF